MNTKIVILGYGPVGKATAELLVSKGRTVRIAQRTRPADLPNGATFTPCDVLDAEAVRQTVAGASQIVVTLGFAYNGKIWRKSWPQAMTNLVAASKASGARMVFVDDLYMYGPQDKALREDMPLSSYGVKPAVRSEITRIWQAAAAAGQVRVAALRAPDFYGPNVGLSHLGDGGFGALARGMRITLIAPPDMPHDFAYVPDIGRAVVTLLDAPDDAFNQVWHMPCAPTRTPRQILNLGAAALGVKPKISGLPIWLLPVLGLVMPMLREFWEMRFQLNRPYHVDSQKFQKRFWSDVTPFEIGVPATAASFRNPAAAARAAVFP